MFTFCLINIHIFDYPDYLLKSQQVRIIKVQLYLVFSDKKSLSFFKKDKYQTQLAIAQEAFKGTFKEPQNNTGLTKY